MSIRTRTATIFQDLRYAVRKLLKSPGFTAVAVVTLGLGIGANTAIFSVVEGVLLRSLPFEAPDRLVRVYTDYPDDDGRYPLSPPDFMSVHDEADVFADVAAYSGSNQTLTGAGEPTELAVGMVSADFFELLGIRPVLGRTFRPEENRAGENSVALLSHALWQQRFGADPAVVGRTLTLNGIQRTVVGVLPPDADFPAGRELYYPLSYGGTFSSETAEGRRGEYLGVVARLAPGVDRERARAAVAALSDRLQLQFPGTNEGLDLAMVPLRDLLVGEVETPLLVLLGAVGLVLLIACANVANLLLARTAARQGELTVRAALGASRGRIARQLLTESVVLGVAGGLLGLLLAYWGTGALVAARPDGIPRLEDIGVSGPVVAFTAGVSLLTGLLFGLVPALQVVRGDLAGSLREGGRGGLPGRSAGRLRSGIVVAEMALAVMLLAGAGLLIRSFLALTAVDPGFRTERVLAFNVSLPSASYGEAEAVRSFYRRLDDRLEGVPGVRSVAAASDLPLGGVGAILTFRVEGREPPARGEVQDIVVKAATPDFFHTLGIPLRRGRLLSERDREDAPSAVVINEAAVRKYFAEQDALGQVIVLPLGDTVGMRREVVGVVGDVKQFGLNEDVRPELYVPHAQAPISSMGVVVRAERDPLALTGAVRRAVRALDPDLPVQDFTTLDQALSNAAAQPRFYTTLLTLFAAIALVLAAIGIFGVMSYAVAQRTREIGIRIALGASDREVVRMVVGRALALAALGLAVGLVGALALTRVLESQLFGIPSTDPITFAAVVLVLGTAAFVSSWLPARRASRVDPMIALRAE